MTPRSVGRRRAILDAAVEVFLDVGYGAATIDAVVERAGGSKATVYAYFGNKERLFAAVVDDIVGGIVRPAPAHMAALPLEEALVHLAEDHMSVVLSERHVALMRLVAAEAKRFPELGEAYYSHAAGSGHAMLESFLRDRVARGELRIDDVKEAAAFFWGMLLHKWTLRRLYNVAASPSAAEIAADARQVVKAFLALYDMKRNVTALPARKRQSA